MVQKLTIQDTVNNIQLDNNVNGSSNKKGKNPLYRLDDAQHHPDHIQLIAADILAVLGDHQSKQFYKLVARKIPEPRIRIALSELKEGGATFPARIFTSKMMDYARRKRDKGAR